MNSIEYTRDNLDDRIQKIEPSTANYADFDTRRTLAYSIVMGEYNQELIEKVDDHVIDDNFSAPLTTGTALIDTDIGDIYKADLPDGVMSIMGDTIFLQKSTGTFFSVTRKKIAEIIIGGLDETLYSFATHKGVITLYSKDTEFVAPGNMAFFYYRKLDTALTLGTTVLDIRSQDFNSIAQRVSEYMISN
jgi:hypothetical protein